MTSKTLFIAALAVLCAVILTHEVPAHCQRDFDSKTIVLDFQCRYCVGEGDSAELQNTLAARPGAHHLPYWFLSGEYGN